MNSQASAGVNSPTWSYATAAATDAKTASAPPRTPGCATSLTQNQIWVELVALACELIAWMQMLALDGPARRYEPKRLRLRLFAVAARLVRGGRRLRLRVAASWPWAGQLLAAITRLQALPAPT